MNLTEIIENKVLTGPMPTTEEMQAQASEQAKGLRVEHMTEANPDISHLEETRRIVASMDEEDARAALDVLVIKHPFVVMDALRGYFVTMDDDLKSLRQVFTHRESCESAICGGGRI